MKTAGRGNPHHWGYSAQHPTPWRGWSEQISFDHLGWAARKAPAVGKVFLLDFPLYRTYQDVVTEGCCETIVVCLSRKLPQAVKGTMTTPDGDSATAALVKGGGTPGPMLATPPTRPTEPSIPTK